LGAESSGPSKGEVIKDCIKVNVDEIIKVNVDEMVKKVNVVVISSNHPIMADQVTFSVLE